MSKDIINYNSKGQAHGYQEWYYYGELLRKCFYNNDVKIDYEEYYNWFGELEKTFYI